MDISCPFCGEDEALRGRRTDSHIELSCEICDKDWIRDLAPRCLQCFGLDLQTVPLAILEKGRGTQLSVVGMRPIDLCTVCDASTLERYNRNRPNPLMPDELPTIGRMSEGE